MNFIHSGVVEMFVCFLDCYCYKLPVAALQLL